MNYNRAKKKTNKTFSLVQNHLKRKKKCFTWKPQVRLSIQKMENTQVLQCHYKVKMENLVLNQDALSLKKMLRSPKRKQIRSGLRNMLK